MTQKSLFKLGLVGLSVVLCAVAAFWNGNTAEETKQLQTLAVSESQPKQALIKVYISGAVHTPGIYEVPKNCRAQEAIAHAGGMTNVANLDRVNLAKICKDGTHINVPKLSSKQLKELFAAGQQASMTGLAGSTGSAAGTTARNVSYGSSASPGNLGSGSAPKSKASKPQSLSTVHLNSASAEELTSLPGVGAATAQRIIEYRNKKAFGSVEEITKVPGIGPAKLNKMRNYLAL